MSLGPPGLREPVGGASAEATWVEGRVLRQVWAAADGGWAVLKVRPADESLGPEVVVVGPVAGILEGEAGEQGPFVGFEGAWQDHPVHGRQLRADAWLPGSPRTEAGLRAWLSGGDVPGVGASLAARIVAHFGLETLGVLGHSPERLREVAGVGPAKAAAIATAWREGAGQRAVIVLLRGLGLPMGRVKRVLDRYGVGAFDVVRRHPYRLAAEISGVGFVLADRLARAQGLAHDDPARVAAAVRHVADQAAERGHTVVTHDALLAALHALDVPVGGLDAAIDEAVSARRLAVAAPAGVALGWGVPRLLDAEAVAAAQIRERVATVGPAAASLDAHVAAAEAAEGVTLDPSQREAVQAALRAGVAVITGGPGTGKTTLVRVLLGVADRLGFSFALASPTGRAARRLAEATGRPAATLHRTLGFNPGEGGFAHDATDPLEVDGLVVDEASMVDVSLLRAVVDALPWTRPARLVFVGDADQLPSVGPGQVLRDLLDSGAVPVARLEVVHRQAARSGIRVAAAAVRAGEVPASGERTGHDDCFLLARSEPDAVLATVREIVSRRLPARGFGPDDVQVLTPTRKGPLGTEALNGALADVLNPDAPRTRLGGRMLGPGDRVIATRNRYDLGVFNGDVGRLEAVGRDTLRVRFEDLTVDWPRDEAVELEPAWALTVHKAQGSEYPAVVLVLHRAHSVMLRRNLAYTALTRARRFFVAVGDVGAWRRAVATTDTDGRRTTLAAWLRGGGDGGDAGEGSAAYDALQAALDEDAADPSLLATLPGWDDADLPE